MRIPKVNIVIIILFLNTQSTYTQEWRTLKSYQTATGEKNLSDGCWLSSDRKQVTKVWNFANIYNLSLENGDTKYLRICEKRDFYSWFDSERKKQGHEIKWAGIAAIAASQLSKFEIDFIRIFIVRNNELVRFANTGSDKVFEFAFPKLRKIYFAKEPLVGIEAENWDRKYGKEEQCEILEPIYRQLSEKSIKQLERMAKGKGIFNLAVPRAIKFDGKINDCNARFEHGMIKLNRFYSNN